MDPYVPPVTREADALRRGHWAGEPVWRVLGTMCMVYWLANSWSDEGYSIFGNWEARLIGIAFMYGFVRGGRRWHGGMAIYLGVGVALSVWAEVTRWLVQAEPLGSEMEARSWWEMAERWLLVRVPWVCAVALCVREWKMRE